MASCTSPNGLAKPGPTLETLPPEILDQIFGNLLKITDDHCHRAGITDIEKKKEVTPTKAQQTKKGKKAKDTAGKVATSTTPHNLPIHTEILLVNRFLSEAGRRYLYMDNRLVMISYSVASLHIDVLRSIINRFITTKHLRSFKLHILDFTFRLDLTRGMVPKAHTGTYLLRECDLRPFLNRLQALSYNMHADHIYLLPSLSNGLEPTLTRYKLRTPNVQ